MNIGEQLVADYLKHIERCDFVDANVYTAEEQGEIDVMGVHSDSQTVFLCEVAIHLRTGLQYVKNRRPNTSAKFIDKFGRGVRHATKVFPRHKVRCMLWSPIVRDSRGREEYNQMRHVESVATAIAKEFAIQVELMINEKFYDAIQALREYARLESRELKSPYMRALQIEEWLGRHLGR